MSKLYVGLGLAVVFAIGCATARFVVPPAHAASGGRWEYFCFSENGAEDVQPKLNAAGAQGWELVATGANSGMSGAGAEAWCMKRPRP